MAMVGYDAIEAAVSVQLVNHISELSTERCARGDLDLVLEAVFVENAEYGAFLDFNGGAKRPRPPFSKPVWVWSIAGMLMIRYTDEIEVHTRDMIDKLYSLFDLDHRLGGIVPLVEIVEIGRPEQISISDAPFFWLPFIIEVIDM